MDATSKHIAACARAAADLGEPCCVTEVEGFIVTVHAPSEKAMRDLAEKGANET